jgi:hypothetical protein
MNIYLEVTPYGTFYVYERTQYGTNLISNGEDLQNVLANAAGRVGQPLKIPLVVE